MENVYQNTMQINFFHIVKTPQIQNNLKFVLE